MWVIFRRFGWFAAAVIGDAARCGSGRLLLTRQRIEESSTILGF